MDIDNLRLAIIGLGYVGLPLAVEFSKKFSVLGFDINQTRINELQSGTDSTLEVSNAELSEAKNLNYSSSMSDLKDCNVYIATVPTPINEYKRPDLSPLLKASEMLGSVISPGDVIIYESTVYPGATEEDCIPVVERVSGLILIITSLLVTAQNELTPATKNTELLIYSRLRAGQRRKLLILLIVFTLLLLQLAHIRHQVYE